jgi:hypothetical protein
VIQTGWQAAVVGLWFLAGAAIEVLNAWTRRLAAGQLTPGRRAGSVGWFVGGFFLRVILTAGVLVLAFRHNFVSGLLAWLGYYLCRMFLIWRLSRRLERGPGQGSERGEPRIGSENG